MKKTVFAVVISCFLGAASTLNAAILSGSVSFNAGMYTYSYVLNNTSGAVTVGELSVLTNSLVADFTFAPTSHTDPGWNFTIAVSGSSANPPLNEFGTFWQWNGNLNVGSSLSGFSFTTPLAPVSHNKNNYFLFSQQSGTIIEFGHIVAPDVVPEPATLVLVALGVVVLGIRKYSPRMRRQG